MKRTRLAAVMSAGLMMTLCATVPSVARADGRDPGTTAPPPPTAAETTSTVRLITGDEVTITATAGDGNGKKAASIRPGAGREGVVFHTSEANGEVTVIPSDADPLVRSGRLDRRLFDVTALVKERYDEAHSATLPLIIGKPAGAAAATVRRLTAPTGPVRTVRELTSIGAQAVTVPSGDLDDFWKQLVPAGQPGDTDRTTTTRTGTTARTSTDTGTGRTRTSTATTPPHTTPATINATPKIWLDGRVTAAADTGVDQINAPEVWKSGYRGANVKVAVLDTGVDQTHPDLTGRVAAAEDFTSSPSGTTDLFGHGTHVASIVAGDGAASAGRYTGVAPEANLLVGKVLGDDGYGYDSQVIAGMQWAADQGAKVVNMSLGEDEASDGTDPMSQALDRISLASGTLFVVAAGNNGEAGAQTVGIPGVADEALTVGAVDSHDALAGFSSRGPRAGDGAVKPDVTAPGVDIVAARAAGTTLGDPVGPYYVTLSGTSMATPHVAGAAALLAQRHPGWSARQLKDALISTADTISGQAVTDQGGGRIDVAAATLGPVTATGSVLLGDVRTTDPSSTVTVTYTNTSASTVTLDPGIELRTAGGRAVDAKAVRLPRGSLVVPAGKTVGLPVTVNPSAASGGSYYGYLTATSPDGSVRVHTTTALVVHGPTHTLKIVSYDRHGVAAAPYLTVWGANGPTDLTDDGSGTATATVEDGTYQVRAAFAEENAAGIEERLVVLPQVTVGKDTTVVADARRTTQVEIRTPRPAEQHGVPYYQTYRDIDGQMITEGEQFFTGTLSKLYVSPTTRVTDGAFEFSSRWQLTAPLLVADAPGTGLDLDAYYLPRSALFDSRGESLTAVDAGSLEHPDLSRVRGKLAVVRDETGADESALAKTLAAAGARGLIVVHFGDVAWTRWSPTGDRDALPAVRIGHTVGNALLARLARHTTTVRFTGTAVSPYLYDVMQTSAQQIPQHVVHTVSARNSAVIRSTYAENGGAPWASEQRYAWRPYQGTAWENTRDVPTGVTRTEYVTSGDTTWRHIVNQRTTFDIDVPLVSGMSEPPTTYRPGPRPGEAWQQAVVRPSIPRGTRSPSVRTGDVLDLRIPEFTDSGAGHWARAVVDGGGIGGFRNTATADTGGTQAPAEGDSARAVLYRGGVKVGDADSAWADFEVPSGPADYRLDLTTSRVSGEWRFATGTDTSWSFRSDTTADAAPLPLLQLDYAVPVGADNAVRAGRSHTVGVTVRAQDGAAVPHGVQVSVETSFNDGKDWRQAKVSGGGHTFEAVVGRPAHTRGDTYVTLRVTARDAAGDRVRQTIDRAYVWRG